LQDLGIHVVATGTKKSTEEDKERIRALMGEDARMIEDGNARALLNLAREYQADILIAGGRNLYPALKARLPFLDVNQEREHGYAGYQGMLTLARQLARALENPVWEAVRRPAPWSSLTSPTGRGAGGEGEIAHSLTSPTGRGAGGEGERHGERERLHG